MSNKNCNEGDKALSIPEDPSLYNEFNYDGAHCGRCQICCKKSGVTVFAGCEPVELHEHKMKIYDTPETYLLPQLENGDCYYLTPEGCAIHGKPHFPLLCRAFDCRMAYFQSINNLGGDYSREIIQKGKIKTRKHGFNVNEYRGHRDGTR